MFRTLTSLFLPNPFDFRLKRCRKKGGKKVLLGWNRGLGDIALGLFAMIQRIYEIIPDAQITFLTRLDLKDGFSLLRNIEVLIDPEMERGKPSDIHRSLRKLGKDPSSFDLIIPKPSPTDWVSWQRGVVTPRLQWDPSYEDLWKQFSLEDGYIYIGVQAVVETDYGSWRNWPLSHWNMLFARLEQIPFVKVILFGSNEKTQFPYKNVIDLRGKTTLFGLLSIVRAKCQHMILPDSGILSMVYYLDTPFPLHVVSLWADPNHGILKQGVASPNPFLRSEPLIGALRDLSSVSVSQVMNCLFPVKPLKSCPKAKDVALGSLDGVGCILLAGGQGSRLGIDGPKGTFPILGKSLFEWICEQAPERNFPIAVMTSPFNHEETVSFFEKHHCFDREIYFFSQETMDYQDLEHKPLNIQGPNGNGSVFRSFVTSGLADLFAQKGVDLLMVVPVENPLADVADRSLIGYARSMSLDVAIKCVERETSLESMGALVEREGNIEIVEYIHLDPSVDYLYSNTGMMALSLAFICKIASKQLPIHWVKKKIPGTKKWGWKGEKFIFDSFPFGRVGALCFEKKSCYAPVKSLESVPLVVDQLKPKISYGKVKG
jgi:hypothetical protein